MKRKPEKIKKVSRIRWIGSMEIYRKGYSIKEFRIFKKNRRTKGFYGFEFFKAKVLSKFIISSVPRKDRAYQTLIESRFFRI